jgi:site-specific DNA-methyltransferase (adenine-specific)
MSAEPYYADDAVTLFNGDAREILPTLGDESIDCVITNPPYSDWTHSNVRSNSKSAARHGNRVLSGNFGFDAWTDSDMREAFDHCGRITRRWVISDLDHRHAFQFDLEPPAHLRMLRIGVWTKTNPMPQISGDRPAMGWEAIVFLHRADHAPKWNGKGRAAVWNSATVTTGDHPTAKPLTMVADWVRLFTNPGDTILDPFAGSGTTLRAAMNEGRKAVGIEIDERYCEVIAKRLSQGVLDFGGVA